jgi:hypothetical protein
MEISLPLMTQVLIIELEELIINVQLHDYVSIPSILNLVWSIWYIIGVDFVIQIHHKLVEKPFRKVGKSNVYMI